jgi:hypothetical protein
MTNKSGLDFWQGQDILRNVQAGCGVNPAPVHWLLEAVFPQVTKRQGREADHSPIVLGITMVELYLQSQYVLVA